MRGVAIGLLVLCMALSTVRADTPPKPAGNEETVEVIDPGKGRKRAALFVALGGLGLWTGSVIVSMVARGKYDKCADNGMILDDLSRCPYQDPQQATDYASKQQKIARFYGTSLFVAGTVAIGAAVYLRFTAPPKRRVVRVSATPSITPDGIGFAVSGSF